MSSSSSSSERDKRILQDMHELIKKDFQVELIDEDKLDLLVVGFHGPKGSLYEDGFWKILVDIPPGYPLKPPSLTFGNTIFHPNISESGSVCVNVLEEKYWNPSYSLFAIFDQVIPQLLREPNPEDPNNHVAAASMRVESKEKFEQRVRECVAEYAKMQDIQSVSSSGDEGSRSSQDQTPGQANP